MTIALSEIVRYVATNEDRLTGGSQGTINLAGAEEAQDLLGLAAQRQLHKPVGDRHQAARLLAALRDHRAAQDVLGPRVTRDLRQPRGRRVAEERQLAEDVGSKGTVGQASPSLWRLARASGPGGRANALCRPCCARERMHSLLWINSGAARAGGSIRPWMRTSG